MLSSGITGITGLNGVQVVPTAVNSETVDLKRPEIVETRENAPVAEAPKASVKKGMTVEEYVRKYFSDIPIMIEVARCESRFRQYDTRGDVLRGEENDLDRGVMQINEYYHNESSDKLGYDILTLEGNTAYARYLFERYGVRPWSSSSPCWAKTAAYSEYKDLALNQ